MSLSLDTKILSHYHILSSCINPDSRNLVVSGKSVEFIGTVIGWLNDENVDKESFPAPSNPNHLWALPQTGIGAQVPWAPFSLEWVILPLLASGLWVLVRGMSLHSDPLGSYP